jgi:hypothetical protein
MNIVHGLSKVPGYDNWWRMIHRCTNSNWKHYKDYGGRGIKVCDRWMKFDNFYIDMGPRPSDGHSLDRINNDGNYEPGNCRWATQSVQSANKRKRNGSTSKYIGVCLTRSGKWVAYFRREYLGCFSEEEDAARAYSIAKTSYIKEQTK